jgi:arylsulfatase A-like enzyme
LVASDFVRVFMGLLTKIMSHKKIQLMVVTLVVVVIAGLVVFGLGRNDKPIERIVLVTIDTLRADHLGCYGYIRDTSPFIDKVAQEGVRFAKLIAPMSTTVPSHSALFTARYPIQLGVIKNGHKAGDDVLTMAEILKSKGYVTAAFTSTNQFISANIHQGFSFFHEPVDKNPTSRSAAATVDAAFAWLKEADPNKKSFIWIHLFDPHLPLAAPDQYVNEIKSLNDSKKAFQYLTETQHLELDFFKGSKEQLLNRVAKYDAEIMYSDHELKRFFDEYKKRGFDSNALWILASDHGEGLGAHNWWRHGKHIYNAQLHVPLIFRFSSKKYAKRVVSRVVENIDIFPTVMELAHVDVKMAYPIQGESMVADIKGQATEAGRTNYAFTQRRHYNHQKKRTEDQHKKNYEPGDAFAIQTDTYKYIYRTEGPDEFFNMKSDPWEAKNILGSKPKFEKELKDKLISKFAQLKKDAPVKHKVVDDITLEKLKGMGYVQ